MGDAPEALAAFAGGDQEWAGRLAAMVKAGAEANGDLRTAANATELLAMTIDDTIERANLQGLGFWENEVTDG